MAYLFRNNVSTTINDSNGVGTGDTTITVSDGSIFPNPANGTVRATLVQLDSSGFEQAVEIVDITAISGNDLTVTRERESTSALTFASGDLVEMRLTRAIMESLRIESLIIPCSDESAPLTTGTAKIKFRMPYAFNLIAVRASLNTAGGTSGTTTIDLNENGTSVLSTKVTIDFGELTSTTAATPAVISDASLADDAEMSIDIDGLTGDATEAGLKVTLIGTQA